MLVDKDIKPKTIKVIPNKDLPSKLKEFICLNKDMNLFKLNEIYKVNKYLAKKAIFKCKERPKKLLNALYILRETGDHRQMVSYYQKEFKTKLGSFAQIRSVDAKLAFELLAKCTKYKFFAGKREGGLLKKVNFEDRIISGDEQAEKVIEHYEGVHKLPDKFKNNITKNYEFPNKEKFNISFQDVLNLFQRFKRDKAFCTDGYNNETFRLCSKCKTLRDCYFENLCEKCKNLVIFCTKIFDNKYFNRKENANKHFKTRLIPLNKVYPAIGNINEYRPIICISSLVKFMEAIMIDDLNDYLSNHLNKNQIGFVPKQETGMNIARLVKHAKEFSKDCKNENSCLLFIDFSSAYDKVLREKLYCKINKKRILSGFKQDLLKYIHKNLKVVYNDKKCTPETGVPQGSQTSPSLFNIYSEEQLDEIEQKYIILKVMALAYADDQVFIIRHEHDIGNIINLIENWAKNNNMIINFKKSGIVPIKYIKKNSIFKNILEYKKFPILQEYKYLGVIIDKTLNFEKALKKVEEKCTIQCARLYIINKCISIADRLFLFLVFICPQYDLLAPQIPFGSKNWPQKVTVSQKKMLKRMLLIRKRAEHRILDCLNPINQDKRRNLNIKRIYYKLIKRFPDEENLYKDMIEFQKIGESKEEKDEEVYKNFHKKCDHDIELYEEINKIGAYKCLLCMNDYNKNTPITLNHLEEVHNMKFDNISLLEDIMKKKTIFKFIKENGEVLYNY